MLHHSVTEWWDDSLISRSHSAVNKQQCSFRRPDISHLIWKCLWLGGWKETSTARFAAPGYKCQSAAFSLCLTLILYIVFFVSCPGITVHMSTFCCGVYFLHNNFCLYHTYSTWIQINVLMIKWHSWISFSCFWDSLHFSVWKLKVTSLFVSHRHNAILSWALAAQDVFQFGFYVLFASDHFSSMSFDLIQIM